MKNFEGKVLHVESLEIAQAIIEAKVIVIIGLPATGKSHFTEALVELLPDHSVYHTDDYMEHGYKESLYMMIEDMRHDLNPKKIIEGVQGYRFLRKNQETRGIIVDLVIVMEADGRTRLERYKTRGRLLDSGFDKNLQTVYKNYLDALPDSPIPAPKFVSINSNK